MRLKNLSILFVFVLSVSLFLTVGFTRPDGKLHIVFCDVGQGDAIYIRYPNNSDMLVDGGPNNKVLNCLGKYMPFYDREIDIVMLTHPQADHLNGLVEVLKRYKVNTFLIEPEGHTSAGYRELLQTVASKQVAVKNIYSGDKIEIGEAQVNILWPTKEFVFENIDEESSSGVVLGAATRVDLNRFSIYAHVRFGDFDVLLTGDGDEPAQKEMIQSGVEYPDVEVLKVPHHGSRTGMIDDFIKRVAPEMAVISVGKNSYGHPNEEIIKRLQAAGATVKRTDRDGNVEVVSDGKGWDIN